MSHSYLFKTAWLTCMTLLAISLNAQVSKTTFKGQVIDESNQPIPGATIMILDQADSTLVQFGSTDAQGSFMVKNVAKGDYLLNINFLGMEPVFMPAVSGMEEIKEFGQIKMVAASKLLGEVKVTADHVPIEITKDTISYNADAFETQPNAVVEDLLKKLPGIEVGADGSIKAQGEDVQKVLVDGKEFFGDDPKMATRNLPAKALKKVKVYDKQSDMAEFTGVDDGTREKTIDLQLKDEFKKGLFGTAQAGYGSDEKYNGKASINRFTKTNQISFLGQLNNINDQGFSFSDRMNFSGGMRGMTGGGGGGRNVEIRMTSNDIPMSDGNNTGVVTTGAAGLNFNFQKNKNFNIRSSYFFNGVDKDLVKNSLRQNLADNPFDAVENLVQNTKNNSHSFSLNSDVQLDSSSQIQLTSRMGIGNGDGLGTTDLLNMANGSSVNGSVTDEDNTSDYLSLSATGTYMKKLGNRGRNFSLSGTINKNDNDADNDLQALTTYFSTGDTEALNQLQFTTSDDKRVDAQFSYTEPLRKRRFLELNYTYSHFDADYDRRVSDITDTSVTINPFLTTDYNSVFQYHRPGATFRYNGEIHNLNIGLSYQVSELDGHVNQNESEIKRSYSHLLPRVNWKADIGNGKHLRFSYSTRVSQPNITQLSPVTDNSDPLRLYVGNPNLDAEYNHNLSLNFHSFSQFSSTSFFTSISGTLTEDKIITAKTFNPQFVEVSSPINIDNETRFSFFGSFGRPFKPIHSRFSINANLSYTNTQNSIDARLLDLNRWSRTVGFTVSNMNSKVLEYNLGARWTFTDSYYKLDESLNQNTLQSNYFVESTLTLWKKWKIEGSYDYNLYSSDEFAENQSLPLFELSISRFVLPNDKGQIKLSVFDVLDENRGISRSVDNNYIEEIRSNSIGRYAMLSFIYSIRGNEMMGGPGGFKIIERRG